MFDVRANSTVVVGDRAEVNFNTGVSRLIGGGGSVKGLMQSPN